MRKVAEPPPPKGVSSSEWDRILSGPPKKGTTMPGNFGPGGKWIHDRAHRIMSESPDTKKETAYAVATQQAHKVGKSPKGFKTSAGVQEAKQKYGLPKKEYQKTAMLAGFFDELSKLSAMGMDLRMKGPGGVKRPPFPTEGSKALANQKLKQTSKPISPPNVTLKSVTTRV